MRNQNSTYFLIDGGSFTILSLSPQLERIMFLQRNVIDTRFFSLPTAKWKDLSLILKENPGYYRFRFKGEVRTLEKQETVDKVIVDKAARCRILSEGYSWLLWYANQVTEQYSTTETLSYGDLSLYETNKELYVKTFAEARNLTIAQAQKQFDFDHETLITVALRRKQIIWSMTESLKLCDTPEKLKTWKNEVFNAVVKVGAV